MNNQQKPNLSTFITLSMVALPLLVVGIMGLTAPELVPWAANPTIAWSLLGVGLIMDAAAVVNLLGELRRVRDSVSPKARRA